MLQIVADQKLGAALGSQPTFSRQERRPAVADRDKSEWTVACATSTDNWTANSHPSPILEIKISNGVYERDSLHRGFQLGEWLLKPGDGSNYSVREFGPGAAPHGAIGFPLSSRGASGFQE